MTSYAYMARDKIKSKLEARPFFNGWNVETSRAKQVQPENIPFLGIYMIDETTTPDGDDNAGIVRFRSVATIGISAIVQNNDAEAASDKLDQAWGEIEKLFDDPTVYNWKNAGKPNEVAIQAFRRGSRTHVHGDIGQENAIPIAEMRYNLLCDLGVIDYEPTITDPFETLHVTTRFPVGGNEEEIAGIQQVQAEYDIPQNVSSGVTWHAVMRMSGSSGLSVDSSSAMLGAAIYLVGDSALSAEGELQ